MVKNREKKQRQTLSSTPNTICKIVTSNPTINKTNTSQRLRQATLKQMTTLG
jgi:hypothetical protein